MQENVLFLSNHLFLSIAVVCVLVLIVIVEWLRAKKSSLSLSPVQATQLINRENAIVIDIRNPEQFRQGHIIDAQSIPSNDVYPKSKKLEKFRTKPLIIVCPAGVESEKLAARLLKEGYNAYSLAGGMRNWTSTQMPIVKSNNP